MSINFTKNQAIARDMIIEWVKGSQREPFILAGYAGTGKTFLLGHVISTDLGFVPKQIMYCAYTGKASQVMRSKGMDANTIHSSIYNFGVDESYNVVQTMKSKDDLAGIKLIVVDEASMADVEIRRDLESFGIPIIYVGDKGQLDPVGAARGSNIMARPNITLDEIMRQEASSGIIIAGQLCRQGKKPSQGTNDNGMIGTDFKVYPRTEANNMKLLAWADIVLCGFNHTRQKINRQLRAHKGYEGDIPQVGEKVVCLKNNRDQMLTNGMTGVVTSIDETGAGTKSFKMGFLPDGVDENDDDVSLYGSLTVAYETFGGPMPEQPQKGTCYFDFGYALSVHKSQGSEFPNVVLVEERLPGANFKEHMRWLYTGITRASRKLCIIGKGL